MRKLALIFSAAAIGITAASAADLGTPAQPVYKTAPMSCDKVQAKAAAGDPWAVNAIQTFRSECRPYAETFKPLGSICGAASVGYTGKSGKVIRPYVLGAGTYTSKHMHDESTGVSKSNLGFGSPEIGGGVCVGLAPRLGAFGELTYAFATGSETRVYPTGWSEKDKLSMLIARIGLTYNVTDRVALGGFVAVGQGWMKYDQSLTWAGKYYNVNGTSDATFVGLGAQLEYAFTDNVSAFIRGEKLWMTSSVPVGSNKTDMERIMVGVKYSLN